MLCSQQLNIFKHILLKMQAGVLCDKFLPMSQLRHRFPEQVHKLGIKVTLLHNHSHAGAGSYLVYTNNFQISTYMDKSQLKNFYPCSWFLMNGKPEAYEFCDEPFEFNLAKVQQNLKIIENRGYRNYGTTVRPIRSQTEYVTKTGHIYVPISKVNRQQNYSETATNGESQNRCVDDCVQTGIEHARYHAKTQSPDTK